MQKREQYHEEKSNNATQKGKQQLKEESSKAKKRAKQNMKKMEKQKVPHFKLYLRFFFEG
jgi:hypothetical protein